MTSIRVADFFDSIKSSRSIVFALLIGGVALIRFGLIAGQTSTNSWDAVIPTVADSLILAFLTLGWTISWLGQEIGFASQEITVLRFGSNLKAFWHSFFKLFTELLGTVFAISLVLVGVGSSKGYSASWSPLASRSVGNYSAFSSVAFARLFEGPVFAVLAICGFALGGMLSIGALSIALAVSGRRAISIAFASSIGLWAALCSFSPFQIPPFLDASLALSLGWGLVVPGGVWFGLGSWALCWAVAFLLLRPDRGAFRDFISGRLGVSITIISLALLAWANISTRSGRPLADQLSSLFAGSQADLVGYALIAGIPIAIASGFVARLDEGRQGFWIFSAARYGSALKLFIRVFLSEAVWATLQMLGLFLLGTLLLAFGQTPLPILSALSTGCLGLLAVTLLQLALVALLFTTRFALSTSWSILAGALLVWGYWAPSGVAFFNFLTPYADSVLAGKRDTAPESLLVLTLIMIILFVITLTRARSQNGESFAER
jgi:hypothetical protein